MSRTASAIWSNVPVPLNWTIVGDEAPYEGSMFMTSSAL